MLTYFLKSYLTQTSIERLIRTDVSSMTTSQNNYSQVRTTDLLKF
jgi:hypothetical protein